MKPPRLKIVLPRFAAPKPTKSQLLIGASALALIGAGVVAWLAIRPTPAAPKPAQEQALAQTAAPEPPKNTEKVAPAAEKPKEAEAHAGAEATAVRESAPQAAPEGHEEGHEEAHGEGHGHAEKSEGAHGEKSAREEKPAPPPLPLPGPRSEAELLMRRLQDIQERVASGDPDSYTEMPRLVRMIGQKFSEMPPETWASKPAAQALALYLLSGGSSLLGRKILAGQKVAPSELPLIKAAVAYLENVEGADKDYLLSLEPRDYDVDLGAQLAFVQSSLLASSDRGKAMERLDVARLLAPGGLVEEAALRREISLLAEMAQYGKFAELSRQYWSRFRGSPYADNFLRQFMAAVARVALLIKVNEWEHLEEFISSLTPDTQRRVYLAVAQAAAVGGNMELADMAAGRALNLAEPDSVERQRALLFRAAARVGAAGAADAPRMLSDVDRTKLPVGDQPIYDAIEAAAARIYRLPEKDFSTEPPGAANDVDASLARAQKDVLAADAAMDSVRKTMERKTR